MRDLWDKPWFSVLTKLTYSAYLNILWLICSLPIFTIGASTTALFYCTLKMAEDRDEGLTRMFFRAFRSNFKPATKLWLILLALGCFLGVDGFVLSRLWNTSAFWTILTALVIGAAVLYAIVLLYAFPLLARFENTTLGVVKDLLCRRGSLFVLHPADGVHLCCHGVDHDLRIRARLSFGNGLVCHAMFFPFGKNHSSYRRRSRCGR